MKWYLKALKQFAVFSGRSRRKEFWMFFLFNCIISFVLAIIEILVLGQSAMSNNESLFANIYGFAVLIPSIAVGVRRMHDVGKSGWFILIPIYNLILAVSDGDKGTNKYGSDPKEEIV